MEKKRKLILIQCASNNNEYTRKKYVDYLISDLKIDTKMYYLILLLIVLNAMKFSTQKREIYLSKLLGNFQIKL